MTRARDIANIIKDANFSGTLDVTGATSLAAVNVSGAIVSSSNGNIAITPNGSGKVILDGLSHPTADGSANQFLKTDGSGNLSFAAVGGTTINSNADNRIISGSGTANTLNGEANLTFNGTTLALTGNQTVSGTLGVTGAVTGTLATAAQPNVTSVGTLASFRSTGIDDNANALAITIDSSENVGIGISNPASYDDGAERLVVGNTSGRSGITIVTGTSNDGSINFADGSSGTASYMGFINYQHNTNTMKLATNASTRLTIDSSGNVGIGLSNPAQGKLMVQTQRSTGFNAASLATWADVIVKNQLDTTGIATGIAFVPDGQNYDNGASGIAAIATSNDSESHLVFITRPNGAVSKESMRIDSSGNVLVGQTSNSISGTGIGLVPNGVSHFYAGGGRALELGRGNNDGEILRLNRSGTTIGNIGSAGSKLHIASNGNAGLRFRDDLSSITPCNADGSNSDNDQNLGQSGVRFKTLFLSGGVRLGGTGTANELDDYEEGSFTPAYSQSGGDTLRTGRYTKVGNMVTIFIRAQYNQTGSTTTMGSISGLPFTILSETGNGTMVFREFSTTGDLFSATLSPNNTSTNNIVNFTNTSTFAAGAEIGIGVEFSYRVA